MRRRIPDTADPDLKRLAYPQYGRLNLLRAISVDTDLIELNHGKVVRGNVTNSTIRIAANGANCASTIPVDIAKDRVSRRYTKYIDGSGLLVTRSERKRVTVCSSSYQIRTAASGDLLTKEPAEISDIVWHLRK